MSLTGNLEDLALEDILQIIGLSRKTGVLTLRLAGDEARVVLRDGQIHGVHRALGAANLAELALQAEMVSARDLDEIVGRAARPEQSVEGLLIERGNGLDPATLEELRRRDAESTIVSLFAWRAGEFSFIVHEAPEADFEPSLLLATPLNAQYLAMEGARAADERSRSAPVGSSARGRGAEDPLAPDAGAEDADLDASFADLDGVENALAPAPPLDSLDDANLDLDATEEAPDLGSEAEADDPTLTWVTPLPTHHPLAAVGAIPPIVVLDPELSVLEWVKTTLGSEFERVHIFQRLELGMTRIRQYLSRGEVPVVLLYERMPIDPTIQRGGVSEVVRRLSSLCPRIVILLFADDPDDDTLSTLAPVADRLPRPQRIPGADRHVVGNDDETRTLVGSIRAASARASKATSLQAIAAQLPSGGLERLRRTTALLHDPASRPIVLDHLLRFAASLFSRVALFQLRGEEVVGLAQLGMEAAGGPSDSALRRIRIPLRGPALFRQVLDRDAPIKAAPSDASDDDLLRALGGVRPSEAYLAPIHSKGRVLAILYGDRHPSHDRIGDTTALEILVYEAEFLMEREGVAPVEELPVHGRAATE
jgi:hypothetical protein